MSASDLFELKKIYFQVYTFFHQNKPSLEYICLSESPSLKCLLIVVCGRPEVTYMTLRSKSDLGTAKLAGILMDFCVSIIVSFTNIFFSIFANFLFTPSLLQNVKRQISRSFVGQDIGYILFFSSKQTSIEINLSFRITKFQVSNE